MKTLILLALALTSLSASAQSITPPAIPDYITDLSCQSTQEGPNKYRVSFVVQSGVAADNIRAIVRQSSTNARYGVITINGLIVRNQDHVLTYSKANEFRVSLRTNGIVFGTGKAQIKGVNGGKSFQVFCQ